MRIMMLAAASALTLSAGTALAGPTTLWAVEVSATGSGVASNAYAEQFGLDGTVLKQVRLGSGFSPGGIGIIGNTGYVASTTDGLIRSFDLTTGVVSAATIATGHAAFGSISFDGTGFWANDYEGGNKAFHIRLDGVQDKAVTLASCGSFCNGLEYFTVNGTSFLIANRGETEPSATYDLYSTNGGAPVTTALLTDVPNGSGVAYNPDSGSLIVADSYGGSLWSYSLAGNLLGTRALGTPIPDSGFGDQRFVTDLAVAVPEPSTLALIASCFGLLGLMRLRRS